MPILGSSLLCRHARRLRRLAVFGILLCSLASTIRAVVGSRFVGRQLLRQRLLWAGGLSDSGFVNGFFGSRAQGVLVGVLGHLDRGELHHHLLSLLLLVLVLVLFLHHLLHFHSPHRIVRHTAVTATAVIIAATAIASPRGTAARVAHIGR